MKKFLLLLITITIGFQLKAETKFDSTEIYHKATVAFENGDVKEEIVYFDVNSPYKIQRSLRIVEKDYYNERIDAGKRIQFRKHDTFKPKEIKHVTIHGGPKFVIKKYADLSEVGFGSIPKNYLLYELIHGDIQLYLLFKESMIVTSAEINNDSTSKEMAMAKLLANSDMIIAKGDEIGKNIETIKIESLIEDKSSVLEAYQNDEFPKVKAAYGSRLKGESYNKFSGFEGLITLLGTYNSTQ